MNDPQPAGQGRGWRDTQALSGWAAAALLLGIVSLGLPWGAFGAPGYLTTVRVPVVAAGIVILLGWRRRSLPLVRIGEASAVLALMLARGTGGGPLTLVVAVVLLEVGVRRTAPLTEPFGRSAP